MNLVGISTGSTLSAIDAGLALRKPTEYPAGVTTRRAGNQGDVKAVGRFARLFRWAADAPIYRVGVPAVRPDQFEEN